MPYLSPKEVVETLCTYDQESSTGSLFKTLIEKLDNAEMLEFLKQQNFQITVYGRKIELPSLFHALLSCGFHSVGRKSALTLFLYKLNQAIASLEKTAETENTLNLFKAQLNLSEKSSNPSIGLKIMRIATDQEGVKCLREYIKIIGVEAFDPIVLKNALLGYVFSHRVFECLSDAGLNEVMRQFKVCKYSIMDKNIIISALTRVTPDTYAYLLGEDDFILGVTRVLPVVLLENKYESVELDALVFQKISNLRLNELVSRTDILRILLNNGHYNLRLQVLSKVSPFVLTEGGKIIKRKPPFDATREEIFTAENNILDFIAHPEIAIKKQTQKFMNFLADHLDSATQIICDTEKWLVVLEKAKKSCPPKDVVTLSQLNTYLWKLKKRPEFNVDGGLPSSSSSSAVPTWFAMSTIKDSSVNDDELQDVPLVDSPRLLSK